MQYKTIIQNIIFICFLSLSNFACSNQKIVISGQIIDATGIPVSQAEIKTVPATDLVSTDKNGYFFLVKQVNVKTGEYKEIPPNIYRIQANKEGFTPLEFSVKAEKGDVWADRQTLMEEKPVVVPIDPKKLEEPTVMPNGSGGVIGY